MTKFERFDAIASKAMSSLPSLNTYRDDRGLEYPEDSNLKDVYHIAEMFRSVCGVKFDPNEVEKLTAQDAVDIVEIVEDNLLRHLP